MKAGECGFVAPPADGTAARETFDRFADFLRLVGSPAYPTPVGKWLVANDPEMRGFVLGRHPITLDDVR